MPPVMRGTCPQRWCPQQQSGFSGAHLRSEQTFKFNVFKPARFNVARVFAAGGAMSAEKQHPLLTRIPP